MAYRERPGGSDLTIKESEWRAEVEKIMIDEKKVMDSIKAYVRPKRASMVTPDVLKIIEMCRSADPPLPYAQIAKIVEEHAKKKIAHTTLKEAWYAHLRDRQA